MPLSGTRHRSRGIEGVPPAGMVMPPWEPSFLPLTPCQADDSEEGRPARPKEQGAERNSAPWPLTQREAPTVLARSLSAPGPLDVSTLPQGWKSQVVR
jgi:hypothetical protein